MGQFTVRGKVTSCGPNQRNVRAENIEELSKFWSEEQIDTLLDWAGPSLYLVTMSAKKLVDQCKPGDVVDYTIETWSRSDGKRIRGVGVHVIKSA